MGLRLIVLLAVMIPAGFIARGVPVAAAHPVAAPSCLPSAPESSGSPARLVAANNAFGFRLLKRIASHANNKNVFISPASVALALDMAYDGAGGSTEAAMATALGVGGMGQTTVRSQASALIAGLKSDDPKVQMQVANALWARNGVAFEPTFTQRIAKAFDAKVSNANFDDPATIAAINGWVSCATHGTIDSIIGKLNPDQVMVLLNALYFHGDWTTPFQSSNTHDDKFYTSSDTAVQMPFMSNRGTYAYAEGSNYQTISLPYGGGRYAMRIVLPKQSMGVDTVLYDMTAKTWNSWTGAMKATPVVLKMPRFTIRNDRVLTSDLSAMGMASAFKKGANFTGICPRCLLSTVLHKTYLQVDEKGTTASAVTGVVVGTTAVPANEAEMTIDRPFLVTIQDNRTGSILFAGEITNPAG
jgi:serpin B